MRVLGAGLPFRWGRILGLAGAVAALPALWALVAATGLLGPGFVGPAATVRALAANWSLLWLNAAPTLTATAIGVAILLGLTALGAVVVALLPATTPALAGLSVVLGTLPLIIVTPTLSLVIPRGAPLVVTVTVLSGMVPVAAMLSGMAVAAARGRDELGALYGTTRLRWWRYVGLWQSVPVLDLGVRTMMPAAFVGAIVAEWSGATGSRGLGQVMVNSLFSYQPPLLWATIALCALASLALLTVASLLLLPLRAAVR
jgi:ABC-type nitrate/sulfonate/bicarbonate transport system permease component